VVLTVFMWHFRTRVGKRTLYTTGRFFENKLHCIVK
jgi:hypothetical protein